MYIYGLPWWVSSKESVWNAGHLGPIPGLGRSPEVGGNGNPLQYSCLENPTDRGAWWAIVHAVIKSQTQLKQLCMALGHGFNLCSWNSMRLIPSCHNSS